jgi:LuxR family maltose regulon positive regulatory protein
MLWLVRGKGLENSGGEQVVLPPRLAPPAALAGAVARPRLHRRLDRALGRGAVLLSAGTGYGKTTLLSSWTAGLGDSVGVAWLSLEPRHMDPVLLAEHLRLALAPFLELPSAPGAGGIVAGLTAGAAQAKRPIVLVLDDAERLEAAEAFAPFGSLLERSPENLTIVVSGRREAPLPWPLLRGRGLLVELGPADLAFDAEETRTLLAR